MPQFPITVTIDGVSREIHNPVVRDVILRNRNSLVRRHEDMLKIEKNLSVARAIFQKLYRLYPEAREFDLKFQQMVTYSKVTESSRYLAPSGVLLASSDRHGPMMNSDGMYVKLREFMRSGSSDRDIAKGMRARFRQEIRDAAHRESSDRYKQAAENLRKLEAKNLRMKETLDKSVDRIQKRAERPSVTKLAKRLNVV